MKDSLRVLRVSGLMIGALICAAAGSCPGETGKGIFDQLLEEFQEEIHGATGFTVHVLIPPLPTGTTIVPDTPGGHPAGGASLRCSEPCVLAMLDLKPRAHFAHPVIIAVYEIQSKKLTPIEAEWWPYNPAKNERYFHTVDERRRTLVCRSGYNCFQFYPPPSPRWSFTTSPGDGPFPTPVPAPDRSVWAVIVNGFDDPDDSFDEDTDGIYQVLKGMGVRDDHICYLTDDTTADGFDSLARRSTVQNALEYVALQTNETDQTNLTAAQTSVMNQGQNACGTSFLTTEDGCTDFLLFYSSHGTVSLATGHAKVLCNHHKVPAGEGHILSNELRTWLAPIKAERMTVVIEACKSGRFEDELRTLPHQNLSFFFSSAPNQASFADIDPPGDPNPGDAGSETIWGFVEAFGTSSADGDAVGTAGHGEVSFPEAVQYARDNDITESHTSIDFEKVNNPPVGPYLGIRENHQTTMDIQNGPKTSRMTTKPDGSPLALIERCKTNEFSLDIVNIGHSRASVSTVRLHLTRRTGDKIHAPTLIMPGLFQTEIANLAIGLRMEDDLTKGESVTIHATVDSPLAPVSSNSGAQPEPQEGEILNPVGCVCPTGCTTSEICD